MVRFGPRAVIPESAHRGVPSQDILIHIEIQVPSRKECSDAVEGSGSAWKVLVLWDPEPRRGDVK